MHGCRQTGSHRSLFFRPAVCIFRKLRYLGIYVDFPGELVPEHIFFPCIQAETAGKRYQDGCGQDTDAGKSRSILLHPVNHPRNGNKILRFIIKGLVFAERFQQSDAPRLKQTVGADNHENHRREKGQKSIGSRIGSQRLHIAGS